MFDRITSVREVENCAKRAPSHTGTVSGVTRSGRLGEIHPSDNCSHNNITPLDNQPFSQSIQAFGEQRHARVQCSFPNPTKQTTNRHLPGLTKPGDAQSQAAISVALLFLHRKLQCRAASGIGYLQTDHWLHLVEQPRHFLDDAAAA